MNRREHLLSCLAEECAEVAQRVSKALRFGLDEVQPGQPLTNAERIVEELNDLLTVADMLFKAGILTLPEQGKFQADHDAKVAKVEKYMRHAIEQGTLIEVSS